eukprot:1141941-Pelagomonas_calceolata.AAC.1
MYANKLVIARRAIENKNTCRSQVMEPGASTYPPAGKRKERKTTEAGGMLPSSRTRYCNTYEKADPLQIHRLKRAMTLLRYKARSKGASGDLESFWKHPASEPGRKEYYCFQLRA